MRLYPKFFLWAALNLVWLGALCAVALIWLLLGSEGRYPHLFFSGGINSAMQIVVANLQYKPMNEWRDILHKYSDTYGVVFRMRPLDPADPLPLGAKVPDALLDSALKIPRPQVMLCPDPLMGEHLTLADQPEIDGGFLPAANALYQKTGGLYWYGRPLFLPDSGQNLHYVLLAASSPEFTGNGLFFNLKPPLFLAGLVLLLSFLWWWPFVLSLTRPLGRIARTADNIAAGNFTLPSGEDEAAPLFSLTRKDEIGDLARAVDSMSTQLIARMCGQRRFIRHIAHELNAPLARARFALALLEKESPPRPERVEQLRRDVNMVSELTNDVLTYLRFEGLPRKADIKKVELEPLLRELLTVEHVTGRVRLALPPQPAVVLADPDCLQRAVSNVLRNALVYAGDSEISIEVQPEGNETLIRVADHGPGVAPTELPHLTEPFFRGEVGQSHPGGSGLGLSIVKYCVEVSNGRLTLRNIEPHGFLAEIAFPGF